MMHRNGTRLQDHIPAALKRLGLPANTLDGANPIALSFALCFGQGDFFYAGAIRPIYIRCH
ncbi:hypothetical protein P4H67_09205 [Paenibacillus lautus]|uniref:hypothetical protein n=1 Tax=Paenibacillus lautus TaxID=1401 RepID=UPI002DBC0AF2|nr:hypothetical protein [Paenibacillus lautus]MEC0306933.1 hypothetical protein [Paenibacillus lautus]